MTQRTIAKALVLAIVVLVPLELVAYVAGKILVARSILYDPPAVEDYANYLEERDPVVGWPSHSRFGKEEIDRRGSRLVPAAKDPAQPSCAALFGDSFTWGDEVSPSEAYGNVLAKKLGCRVANYGVGGYGTDQAYLRYSKVVQDDAPVVVLGHYSENIIRNINQNRGFLSNVPLGLKPRFRLKDGRLELVPLPRLSQNEYESLDSRAEELLPFDYFAPGGPGGVQARSFPNLVSVVRAFGHYRIEAAFESGPSYASFYQADHESQALAVTHAILTAFVAEAEKRQQKPLVLLIPDEKDLLALRETGTLPYAPLVERLEASGIKPLDAGRELESVLNGREPCSLYQRCGGAHFNPDGYAKLAELVHRALKERGWIPK